MPEHRMEPDTEIPHQKPLLEYDMAAHCVLSSLEVRLVTTFDRVGKQWIRPDCWSIPHTASSSTCTEDHASTPTDGVIFPSPIPPNFQQCRLLSGYSVPHMVNSHMAIELHC